MTASAKPGLAGKDVAGTVLFIVSLIIVLLYYPPVRAALISLA